jgi:hypothetical protein
MAYDIIGDIHGQADKLYALLAQLGYRRGTDGAYRHPDRTAIFVGDFIDRGPAQVDSVMTVRRMVDAGSALAVMGNHEFNAIAWHIPDPQRPGDFLRTHDGGLGERNLDQHKEFLSEVQNDTALHTEVIDWFLTLPLWIDLPGISVVHACWHPGFMEELRPVLTPQLQLTRQAMVAASRPGAMEYRNVEALTKGLEVALPAGHSFNDKDGHVRRNVRIRWWDVEATTYRQLALMDDKLRERLPDTAVPRHGLVERHEAKPVFFGHYWMTGAPASLSPTRACVDYSAARKGPLVAYRWDGEPVLDGRNFASAG